MKAPMNWLGDFVDIRISAKAYADAMTMSGSKVEAVEDMAAGFGKVVAGRIISMEKHPDADKLQVCQVDVGTEVLQIVTGAPNVKPGDSVPLALVGATLPGGTITASKLRGVSSYGMMCSMEELNLTREYLPDAPENGVYVIPGDPAPGSDMKVVLGLDRVVDFEITSNRPDCLCMIGLARETAATLGVPMRIPSIEVSESAGGNASDRLRISVSDYADCIRYSARLVEDVQIRPSPPWMQRRLAAAGMRPINNIVDITNYVMLEWGQPMHAFDFDRLTGGEIRVRRAGNGERIQTLDNQERELDSGILVIADADKAVAIAGVMGGANSEVTSSTKTLLLESATFAGGLIRRAGKKLGLRSEASGRFEKGLDPRNTTVALDRCAELIEQLGAGRVMKGIVDNDGSNPVSKTILLEPSRINAFLGTDIPVSEMLGIFTMLGFGVDPATCVLTVPGFRSDIEWMEDLAEEVARFHGYNNIKPSLLAGKELMSGRKSVNQQLQDLVVETLLGCGLSEACTLSFASPKIFDTLRLPPDDSLRNAVVIENPLGEDFGILRTTTLPDMLRVLSTNNNRKVSEAWLFEIAHTYHPMEEEPLPLETLVLSLGLYGGGADFHTLKGVVEQVLAALAIHSSVFLPVTGHPSYHPGRTAFLKVCDASGNWQEAGHLGEVHPDVAAAHECPKRPLVAELDLGILLRAAATSRTYSALPRFPATTRDIAAVVSVDVTMSRIVDVIRECGGELLKDIVLFDVYKGGQLEAEQKSMAFSLAFRAPDRTLTDEDVNAAMTNIFSALAGKLGAVIRS